MNSNAKRKVAWGIAGLTVGGFYWLIIYLLINSAFFH